MMAMMVMVSIVKEKRWSREREVESMRKRRNSDPVFRGGKSVTDVLSQLPRFPRDPLQNPPTYPRTKSKSSHKSQKITLYSLPLIVSSQASHSFS
jgi:hypothetical protein